jgi:hypothetical protein
MLMLQKLQTMKQHGLCSASMENAITIVSNKDMSIIDIPMSNLHKNKFHLMVKVNGHILVKERPLMEIMNTQMWKKNNLKGVSHHMSHLSQKKNNLNWVSHLMSHLSQKKNAGHSTGMVLVKHIIFHVKIGSSCQTGLNAITYLQMDLVSSTNATLIQIGKIVATGVKLILKLTYQFHVNILRDKLNKEWTILKLIVNFMIRMVIPYT